MDDVQAPFAVGVVRAINAFQASGADGGLSCPSPLHDTDPMHPATMLFATKPALICPDPGCGYRQLWAPSYAMSAIATSDLTSDLGAPPPRVADEARMG